MAAIVHQTSDYVNGLWLFDHEALTQLDTILDEALEGFADIRTKDLDSAFRQEQKKLESERLYQGYDDEKKKEIENRIRKSLEDWSPYSQDKREIAISFTSGKTLVVPRFTDAFNKPEIQSETPTVFTIETRCGTSELKLELPSYSPDRLQISVTPKDLDLSAEVFVKLKLWAEKKRQPTWQRYWQKYLSAFGTQWLLWVTVIFLPWAVYSFFIMASGPDNEKVKEEARQLLQKGLTKEDESRAIELILAISSDYPESRSYPLTTVFPRWWLVFATFTFLIAICLSFPPATVIGIGRGSIILDRRKTWLAFVRALFVTFALLSVGGSWVATLLNEFLKR